MSLHLSTSVSHLPLVGPSYSTKLKKLGIITIEDLLHHYPFRYLDRSTTTSISQLTADVPATIVAQILDFRSIYTRSGKTLQSARVTDGSGSLSLTWFNQPYLKTNLLPGLTFAFSGKPRFYQGKLTLTAPEFEKVSAVAQQLHTGRLVPVYPETAKVSSKWLRSRIKCALSQVDLSDFLPPAFIETYHLIPLSSALTQIHFPDSLAHLSQARSRLAFDELFFLQLQGAIKRHTWTTQKTNFVFSPRPTPINAFIKSLPFSLTTAQQRSIKEILKDLNRSIPMNRLLEGDVGSGKTIVAAIAMYQAFLNQSRSLLMAPTEILASQHYQTLTQIFRQTSIKIGLVTSSQNIHSDSDIVIGTHALLFRELNQQQVGLIVIDEQHRFGVEQRLQLENLSHHPHCLTMSATPIPRSVALTLYGDLDVSCMDELPHSRLPIKTWLVPESKRPPAYTWIKDQIVKDQAQVFVVCPLIDPSLSTSLQPVRSATQEYTHLQTIFPEFKLGLLHGRMKSKLKDQVIDQFQQGLLDILVTTPVIEVGIDVPQATIIVIESAERFGLAQLHQIRGRVGRSHRSSYCLLFTSTEDHAESSRLEALQKHHSGYRLARIDLKLRGPGEVFGLSQHGFRELKIARLTDTALISTTKQAATALINSDPTLASHPEILRRLPANDQATPAN